MALGGLSQTLAFVAVITLLLIEPSLQCGMTTHNFIGRRALFWANLSRQVGDTAMNAVLDHCLQHQDAFQAGCAFPDWGYNCMGFGDASEAAHWVPFIEQASLYLHASYANASKRSVHDDKFAAFLFGVMSHSVADISWHNLGPVASLINQGMIQQLAVENFAGDYDQAHSTADVGGEMINSYEQGLPWLRDVWWVPARDLTVVYEQLNLQVEVKPLVECNAVLFVGAHAVKDFGDELFEMHVDSIAEAPFLMNNLKDYWIGGLDDMATWTSYCWSPIADWIVNGTANISSCLIEPPANPASPLLRRQRNAALHRLARLVLDSAPNAIATEFDEETGSVSLRVDSDKIKEVLAHPKLRAHEEEEEAPSPTPLYGCTMRPNVTSGAPQSDQQAAVFATNAPYSYLGTAMATGDWNGDGIADLAISASGFSSSTNGGPNAGRVYVFFALPASPAEVPIIVESDASLILDGEEYGARFGAALVTIDYNLDGVDDLCIGASSSGALDLLYYGRIACHLGSTDTPLSERTSIIGQCASSNACTYQFANLGSSLSAIDVNFDGYPDLVAGTPSATIDGVGPQAGAVLGFFASTQNSPQQQDRMIDTADLQLQGSTANSRFGSAVVKLDKTTLLVSEPYWSPNPSKQPQAGRVLAYALDINSSATPLYSIEAALAYAGFGSRLAVGPLTFGNQSTVVVAISALSASSQRGHAQAWQAGEVYLIDASSLVGLNGSASLLGGVDVLSTLTGESNGAAFGQTLSIADVNGDGNNDLVIGQFRRSTAQSQLTDTPVRRDAGALFAFLGGSPSLSFANLSPFQSAADWCAGFPYERAWFGESIVIYRSTATALPVLLVSARVDSRFAERAGTVEVLNLTSQLP